MYYNRREMTTGTFGATWISGKEARFNVLKLAHHPPNHYGWKVDGSIYPPGIQLPVKQMITFVSDNSSVLPLGHYMYIVPADNKLKKSDAKTIGLHVMWDGKAMKPSHNSLWPLFAMNNKAALAMLLDAVNALNIGDGYDIAIDYNNVWLHRAGKQGLREIPREIIVNDEGQLVIIAPKHDFYESTDSLHGEGNGFVRRSDGTWYAVVGGVATHRVPEPEQGEIVISQTPTPVYVLPSRKLMFINSRNDGRSRNKMAEIKLLAERGMRANTTIGLWVLLLEQMCDMRSTKTLNLLFDPFANAETLLFLEQIATSELPAHSIDGVVNDAGYFKKDCKNRPRRDGKKQRDGKKRRW